MQPGNALQHHIINQINIPYQGQSIQISYSQYQRVMYEVSMFQAFRLISPRLAIIIIIILKKSPHESLRGDWRSMTIVTKRSCKSRKRMIIQKILKTRKWPNRRFLRYSSAVCLCPRTTTQEHPSCWHDSPRDSVGHRPDKNQMKPLQPLQGLFPA